MIKLEIIEMADGKVFIAKADDLFRYELRDEDNVPLKWKRIEPKEGSKRTVPRCFTVVTGTVTVMRKPTLNQVHREVMAHSGYANYIGQKFSDVLPDPQRVVDNLQEVEGKI